MESCHVSQELGQFEHLWSVKELWGLVSGGLLGLSHRAHGVARGDLDRISAYLFLLSIYISHGYVRLAYLALKLEYGLRPNDIYNYPLTQTSQFVLKNSAKRLHPTTFVSKSK